MLYNNVSYGYLITMRVKRKQLISRHEVECTLEDIIENGSKLLKDLGEFYMVHRAERLVDIMCLLRKYKLDELPELPQIKEDMPEQLEIENIEE